MAATSSRVRSAERTLDVLLVLSRHRNPLSALEISAELGMPKSTTHHLLNAMAERRFVAYRKSDRTWSLGIAAFEIGAAYSRNGSFAFHAAPFLKRLSESGVTGHLASLQGNDVVYLDKREPASQGVRLVTEVGTHLPAHLTAVGRAILSTLDDERLDKLFENYSWPLRTDRGPTSLSDLRAELETSRQRGFAEEHDNTTNGIVCIASAVTLPDGEAVGALGVAFLSGVKSPTELDELRELVPTVAREFSTQLASD
ncbi:MAG: hypothetical protein RLZZ319_705 [Actinomycetota bacterium]|jgi:DNA-binding IclR family transcriptional regulator